MRLPHSVPSSRKQASSVTVIARPPRETLLPTGRPAPALPSVMAMVRSTRLARMAAVATAGMHVIAVADDLRRHGVLGQHGAGQAGRAVRQRRHPVEQVGGVPGAGGDPRQRLLVGRGRVAQRHPMAGGHERLRQVEPAVQLDRHGDDAHVAPVRLDHPQHVGAGVGRRASTASASASPSGPRRGGRRRQSSGWAPRNSGLMKLLSRWAGRTRACGRAEARARRMLSIRRSSTAGAQATEVGQNAVTPIADQAAGDLLDGIRRVEGVEALDAVDVDVDEPGDEGVAVQIDEARRRAARRNPPVGPPSQSP